MIIEVDNLDLSFGDKKILYGVYLKMEKGQITGILGRNGSGKTCLLKIIFGSLRPQNHSIRIDGAIVKGKPFVKNLVSYLPQHRLLPKSLSIKRAFSWFGASWPDFLEQFASFEHYFNSKSGALSSGELKVIETYLILQSKKDIILLDEPFSFIAPIHTAKIKELILRKKEQSTIVITDHSYEDVVSLSDRLYFLKNGCSSEISNIEDLENLGYLLPRKTS